MPRQNYDCTKVKGGSRVGQMRLSDCDYTLSTSSRVAFLSRNWSIPLPFLVIKQLEAVQRMCKSLEN